jgi:hypothetical protein
MNSPNEDFTTAAVENNPTAQASPTNGNLTADFQDISLAPGDNEVQHVSSANNLAELRQESDEEESDEYESDDVCNIPRCQMAPGSHMILGGRVRCTP